MQIQQNQPQSNPLVNYKLESFCIQYAQGVKPHLAYKNAFNSRSTSTHSLKTLASACLKRLEVKERIKEIQRINETMSEKSREEHIKYIEKIAFGKLRGVKHNDQLRAFEILNQMKGFNLPSRQIKAVRVEYVSGNAQGARTIESAQGLQTLNEPISNPLQTKQSEAIEC